MVDLSEFDNSDKGCYLTAEGRKAFLMAYNKKIRSENQIYLMIVKAIVNLSITVQAILLVQLYTKM